jgi:hypothetical protein
LCRKEIEMYRSLLNNEQEEVSWSFGLRFESKCILNKGNSFFSWLPNMYFSFFGTNEERGMRNDEIINTSKEYALILVSEMFPNTTRDEILSIMNRTNSMDRTINELLLN